MTLSSIGKIKQALDAAKDKYAGCILTYFDVLELRGYVKDLEAMIAEYQNHAEPARPKRETQTLEEFIDSLPVVIDKPARPKRKELDALLTAANAEIESMHRELAAKQAERDYYQYCWRAWIDKYDRDMDTKQAIIDEQEHLAEEYFGERQEARRWAIKFRDEAAKLREWGKKDKAIIALLEKERDEARRVVERVE